MSYPKNLLMQSTILEEEPPGRGRFEKAQTDRPPKKSLV